MRHRYLRPALTMPQIYLYRAPIDFRKQVHGLAALVEQQLGHNPFTVSALESASVFSEISSSHLKSITSSLDFHHDHSRTC